MIDIEELVRAIVASNETWSHQDAVQIGKRNAGHYWTPLDSALTSTIDAVARRMNGVVFGEDTSLHEATASREISLGELAHLRVTLRNPPDSSPAQLEWTISGKSANRASLLGRGNVVSAFSRGEDRAPEAMARFLLTELVEAREERRRQTISRALGDEH